MKSNAYRSQDYQREIFNNPRTIRAKIVVNGVQPGFTQENIKSFKIDSTPVKGKWWGISYAQQLNVVFRDPTKSINISRDDSIKVSLKCEGANVWVDYPTYYVDTVSRDEKTGDLSATGFDIMAKANNKTFKFLDENLNELSTWQGNYNDLITQISRNLGCNATYVNVGRDIYHTFPDYTWKWKVQETDPETQETKIVTTINIPSDGFSLRDMITAFAEASGRFAYINCSDWLLFRMVCEPSGRGGTFNPGINYENATERVDKTRYFELTTDKPCTLTGIQHKNELNDIVSVGNSNGVVQVLYDNPLLSLIPNDSDIETILNFILNNVYQTVTPCTLTWRGDMACEIGENFWVAEKQCNTSASTWNMSTPNVIKDYYYLSETLEYNGGLRGTTEWQFEVEDKAQIGPSNVSTNSKTVRALVDKANGEIRLIGEGLGPSGAIRSELMVEAGRVSSTVVEEAIEPSGVIGTEIAGIEFEIGELSSEISQTAGEISTLVQAIGPTGAVIYSAISQTATDIKAEVYGPTGVKAIFDMANGPSGSQIYLGADKIVAQGGVEFITPADVGPTGSTTIYGGRIQAHTITTNEINTTGLFVQDVEPLGGSDNIHITASNDGLTLESHYDVEETHPTFKSIHIDGDQVQITATNSDSPNTPSRLFLQGDEIGIIGQVGDTAPTNSPTCFNGQIYYQTVMDSLYIWVYIGDYYGGGAWYKCG